jgi:hypothetical protein
VIIKHRCHDCEEIHEIDTDKDEKFQDCFTYMCKTSGRAFMLNVSNMVLLKDGTYCDSEQTYRFPDLLKEKGEEYLKVLAYSTTKWDAKTIEDRIKKIDQLIHRNLEWKINYGIVKANGKLKTCEICGNEDYGDGWCGPCIHRTWCCVCCMLLGIPNYSTAIFKI